MSAINKRQIIKNVGSSWFSLSTDVAVGIFLSPFVVHRLGDTAFGIWVLIFSITGYYGLFDMGIRSSVVRYVSKFTATDSIGDLAKLINTALFTYSCVGAASFVVTGILAYFVGSIFKIPPEMYTTARWLLVMVGTSVGLGFPLGVMGGVLDGLQRFYVNNWANVAGNFIRLCLIVYALKHGRGLLTVAAITVSIPLMLFMVKAVVAYHLRPFPVGFKHVSKETFSTIVKYSSVTMIVMVATQLKFKTDNVVIGSMISAAAVTYFAFGSRIVNYAQQVVMALAQNVLPIASQSEATGNIDRLRKVFVAGNRFCAFTSLPITATLLVLGRSVIEVWVGKKYAPVSYPVLVILIIPATLMWSQAASGRVLFGTSKHKTWAFVTLTEGICNLILSIVLVHFFQRAASTHGPYYGIYGDALGTAIPLAATMIFFMPRHMCRLLGIRMRTYLREAFTLPILITIPLVATLLLMRFWYYPNTYRGLAVQLVIAGMVYGLGLLWVFKTKRAFHVGELAEKDRPALIENRIGTPVAAYPEEA